LLLVSVVVFPAGPSPIAVLTRLTRRCRVSPHRESDPSPKCTSAKEGFPMAVVNPIPNEKAGEDLKSVYDNLTKAFGRVPNIFAVMAHRPAALKNLLALYGSVMQEGTVEPKYKELAYLKTSMLNGCEY